MLMICYPNCSTCKKAQKWLATNNIPYTYRNIQQENPTVQELTTWIAQSALPLKRFFNTSGQAYRSLQLKDSLPKMSQEEQIALLATDGMLVKRPLMIGSNHILVGFKEEEWEKAFLP